MISNSEPPADPFTNAMTGVLRRPGRGKRAGQWVNSGGEYNGLTQDEVYGRVRAKQGGGPTGSGPGGGLRTGGLGGGPSAMARPTVAAPPTTPAAPPTTPAAPPTTPAARGDDLQTTSVNGSIIDLQGPPAPSGTPTTGAPAPSTTPPAAFARSSTTAAGGTMTISPTPITSVNGSDAYHTKGQGTTDFKKGVDWSPAGGNRQPAAAGSVGPAGAPPAAGAPPQSFAQSKGLTVGPDMIARKDGSPVIGDDQWKWLAGRVEKNKANALQDKSVPAAPIRSGPFQNQSLAARNIGGDKVGGAGQQGSSFLPPPGKKKPMAPTLGARLRTTGM